MRQEIINNKPPDLNVLYNIIYNSPHFTPNSYYFRLNDLGNTFKGINKYKNFHDVFEICKDSLDEDKRDVKYFITGLFA